MDLEGGKGNFNHCLVFASTPRIKKTILQGLKLLIKSMPFCTSEWLCTSSRDCMRNYKGLSIQRW